MEKIIPIISVFIFMLIAIGLAVYTFYMAWFRPSDFLKQSVKSVSDRQPFANFYRSYYASWKWLWAMRLGALFSVLVIGFLIGGTLLHFLGVIP